MTFSLQQILTDPKLQCPQGDVQVQFPVTINETYELAKFQRLIQLLKNFQIKFTYHGNGLLTIHNK